MRVRKDPEERQQEIVLAAVDACTEAPFDKVSITSIAKSIGISKAAIYFYYPSKEALFKDVVLHSLTEPLEALERAKEQELPLNEKLTKMLSDSLVLAVSKPKHLSKLINSNSDYALEVKQSHAKKSLQHYREVIQQACDNDEISLAPYGLTVEAAAKLLLSGAFGIIQGTNVGTPFLPKAQMIAGINAFVASMIAGWQTS